MNAQRLSSIAILCAFLTACGGGGGSTPPVKSPAQGGGTGTMAIKLTVHKKTGVNRRGRHYVSYNTQGIGISVGAHGSFTAQTLTTGLRSPQFASEIRPGFVSQNVSCTNYDSNNAYSCVLSIAAPSGYDDFQLTTWDQTPSSDGYGGTFANTANDLSTNVLSNQLVLANQTNNFNFSLDGVVVSVALSLSSSTMVAGAPSGTDPNTTPVTLSVFAEDADGNYIVGADPYVDGNGNPVTITLGTPTYSPSVQPSGGTEYIKTTYVNGIGETAASAEASASLTQGQVTVASPAASGNATGYNVYASDASGAEKLVNTSGPIAIGTEYQVTLQGSGAAAPATDTSGGLNAPVTPVLMPVEDGSVSFGTSSFSDPTTTSTTVSYDGGSLSQALISASVGSPTTPISVNTAALDFTQSNNGSVNVPGNPTIQEFIAGSGGTPIAIAAGPDGNMWYTDRTNGEIGKAIVGTTNTVEYSTGSNHDGPTWIAEGSDGNMWFTEWRGLGGFSPDAIGYINPSTHAVTSFNIPAASANPQGITLGSDGNMWFTETGVGNIGCITPAGAITEYALPAGVGSAPFLITSGADGKVYFTENGANNIGSSTVGTLGACPVAPAIAEYPTNGTAPVGITSGPDGNIWFLELNAGNLEIANFNIGTHVEVDYQTTRSTPSDRMYITTGNDGNLWITNQDVAAVARITPSGQGYVEYFNGIGATPTLVDLAPGPDGKVWFADANDGSLGTVTLP